MNISTKGVLDERPLWKKTTRRKVVYNFRLLTSDCIRENVTEHSRQDLPQKGFDGLVKVTAPQLEL